MLSELGLSRKQVIRYAVLPGIFPRLKRLLASGFPNLPFCLVTLFNTLRIIPNGHPYLRPENYGKYSTFKALAVAANNITFDRKNIDKITIFFVVLGGIAMMALQLVLFVMALFAVPAYAAGYNGPGLGPRTYGAFFNNDNPTTDIAFRMLDLVFGVPGIFETGSTPTPFHAGFHALLAFYSYGILLVGVFVIIYLVTAIVLETAQEGVPFGHRFNKAWVPVRLILFFGLLLPTPTYGINVAQYAVLYSAKWGSNLATNAWLTFDRTTHAPYIGTGAQLVATPNVPDFDDVVSFMTLARTCSIAEGRINSNPDGSGYDVQPYLVYGAGADNSESIAGGVPAFTDIVQKAHGGTLIFRFGVKDETRYPHEPGAVSPVCGELAMDIVDQAQPGAAIIQQAYAQLITCLWNGTSGDSFECPVDSLEAQGRAFTDRYSGVALPANAFPDMTPYTDPQQKRDYLEKLSSAMNDSLINAVNTQADEGDWNNDAALNLGWGGAGIWFNKIAEQNGALTSAIFNKPTVRHVPAPMEFVRQKRTEQNAENGVRDLYNPVLSNGTLIQMPTPEDAQIARVLNQQYYYWGMAHPAPSSTTPGRDHNQEPGGNIVIDMINMMLGTSGLFDMCKNADVHPLAALSSLGKGLIEHSIRGFGAAFATGLLSLLDKQNFGASLAAATSLLTTFATTGLTLGFLLFYVIPFLPFIYFFFAVMTWVKSVFEAMVGMPVWALGHLRIDGEGMPGPGGEAGYFYILEIFLRPVIIIIAFIGSIAIFGTMVKVLNEIFYLVISNLSGHTVNGDSPTGCFNPPAAAGGAGGGGGGAGGAGTGMTEAQFQRGILDEFFYTVMYAVVVYMIGIPCFKMVDQIPDRIMRWMGSSISSFGSQDGDPAGKLMEYISIGAGGLGSSLGGGLGMLRR